MLGRSSISVQAIMPARMLRRHHIHQSRASGFVLGSKPAHVTTTFLFLTYAFGVE